MNLPDVSQSESSKEKIDSECSQIDHGNGECSRVDTGRPKNVPAHLWEKFKSLEKRTNETIKRSTEKRIKHLQKQVLDTVSKGCASEDERRILREHEVKFELLPDTNRKRKPSPNDNMNSSSTSNKSTEKEEIISLMSVNNHLQTTDHSRPPPETALEKRLALAIKERDFSSAEAISDNLATLEAGEKVAAAFDAKRFLQQKEREQETAKSKKKRKLNWGFEAKQRWETKGNM